MSLARPAGEIMATALQPQLLVRIEADRCIGAVDLFFDHEMAAGNLGEICRA